MFFYVQRYLNIFFSWRSKAWASNMRNWRSPRVSPAAWTPPSSHPHLENRSRCSRRSRTAVAPDRMPPQTPSSTSPVHRQAIRRRCPPTCNIHTTDSMRRIWGEAAASEVVAPWGRCVAQTKCYRSRSGSPCWGTGASRAGGRDLQNHCQCIGNQI